MSIFQSMIMTW